MKYKGDYHSNEKKERTIEDYLDLFSGRNNEEEFTSGHNDRCNKLYNLSIIKRAKEEHYRQKVIEQRDRDELAECSFVPKINKNYKYKELKYNINNNEPLDKQKIFEKQDEPIDQNIQNLLKRQDEWIQKKKLKMEKTKENEKKRQNFMFSPEINKNNKKILDFMKLETQQIVADPESYKEFIDRNKKPQKTNLYKNNNIEYNNKQNNVYSKNKNGMYNNKYDYTEHKLLNNNLVKSTSYNQGYKVRAYKSVDFKKQLAKKNIPLSKTQINNINDEDIYTLIYLDSKDKYENRINDGFNEQEIKNIFNGKSQLEFKEALDILHEKLLDLDILGENDDNDI